MRGTTAVLLALMLLGAGCLGTEDGDGEDLNPNTQDPPEDPGDAEPATTNTTSFQTQTESGTVTGSSTPLGSATVAPASENQAFSFQVPDGTRIAYLNLTANGGELQMNVADPACEVSAMSTCENTTTTSSGAASVVLEDPESGTWNVRFFTGETVGQVDYTLEIALGVVEAA